MKVKEIIFDFDGTIADTFGSLMEVLSGVLVEFELRQVTQADIDIYRNSGAKEALKKLKVPLLKLPKIIKRCQEEQAKKIPTTHIFDGLKPVLENLKNAGFVLGVITSNSKDNVEKFFNNNNLKMFNYIYDEKNLFGKDKVIKHLLKVRKLNYEEVIYVGDEVRDVEACKKAGVKIISVDWGFNTHEALKKSRPDYLISQPIELKKILT